MDPFLENFPSRKCILSKEKQLNFPTCEQLFYGNFTSYAFHSGFYYGCNITTLLLHGTSTGVLKYLWVIMCIVDQKVSGSVLLSNKIFAFFCFSVVVRYRVWNCVEFIMLTQTHLSRLITQVMRTLDFINSRLRNRLIIMNV